MKNFRILILLLAVAAVTASCSKEETLSTPDDLFGLGGETYPKTEVDEWLDENMLNPYNIEVKYHWDGYELDYDKTLVPIKSEMVVPMMEMVKKLWIQPYEDCAGGTFVKKLCPKKIVLVGSDKYDGDGNSILGEAEGGRKIVLYRGNKFKSMTEVVLRLYVNTIQHEFAHILHQTINYSPEFNKLSAGLYNPTGWTDTSVAEAQEQGFVSRYASSAVDEDFAEMVALILINGKDWFDEYASGSSEAGQTILRKKEAIVVDYFKTAWGISFYNSDTGEKGLVTIAQKAMINYIDDEGIPEK